MKTIKELGYNLLGVDYASVWEEGVVTTSAILNLENGEITDIQGSFEGADYEYLQYEKIHVGEDSYIVEDKDGDFEYKVSKEDLETIREKL